MGKFRLRKQNRESTLSGNDQRHKGCDWRGRRGRGSWRDASAGSKPHRAWRLARPESWPGLRDRSRQSCESVQESQTRDKGPPTSKGRRAIAREQAMTVMEVGRRPRAKPVNRLNDLSAKEWIPETVSVWIQRGLGKGHQHAQIEKQHPAPFSFQDVARLIRFFSKSGETVLDPFAGVGSTLKAAAREGRSGIGIELNPRYVKLARRRLFEEVPSELLKCNAQRIVEGDARAVLPKLPNNSANWLSPVRRTGTSYTSKTTRRGKSGSSTDWILNTATIPMT